MSIEELEAAYGKPELLSTITHVLAYSENVNHDRITVEVLTEDAKRLKIRFTQEALRSLIRLISDDPSKDRPKAN